VQLADAEARVKELEAAIVAGRRAGDVEAGAANEMEFLRKERRAEVEQVDQEWRRRWEALQAQCSQLQSQLETAASVATVAAAQHVQDVQAAR
jgi:hypothetical protein